MPSTSAACSADACELSIELASELSRLRCSGVSRSTQATDAGDEAARRRRTYRPARCRHRGASRSTHPRAACAPDWRRRGGAAVHPARGGCLDLLVLASEALPAPSCLRASPAAHGGSHTGGRCVCLARVPGVMHSVARPPRSGASCRLYHSLLSPTVCRCWEATAQRRRGGHHCHQFHPATCCRINRG